jgi:hypothetical protein
VPGRATLRSASNHHLVVTSSNRKIGDRPFSVAGPRAWNRLPIELKVIPNTPLFKRQLKTHFLKLHMRNNFLNILIVLAIILYH